jgi:hypothetical protein
MKVLTCSFCGEPLNLLHVQQGEERFCSSRHRNYWNQRSEGAHRLIRLQQNTSTELEETKESLWPKWYNVAIENAA